MINVCMLTHSYYLRDPRVRREAETLASRGYSVDVICLQRPGEPARETVSNVKIYRLPLTHRRQSKVRYVLEYACSALLMSLALSVLHLRRRYALVQVNTPPDILVFSALVPKLFGARVLLDLHDPMPEAMHTKFKVVSDHWLVRLARVQEAGSTHCADHVVTVTEQVRQALINRSLSPDKVSVIMNFADMKLFQDCGGKANQISSQDEPILVYMGTLARQYGVDVAIDALAILRNRIPSIRLKIIGDGEERPNLERQVDSLGLRDAVIFTGMVPIDQIPEVALPAHVGLAPHRRDRLYDMCFPSKVYDYLALGLPVVACRTESLEYYYGQETLAFFKSEDVEGLANQTYDLLTNPERVKTLQSNAASFLQEHNWAREHKRYLDIVRGLLG